MPDAVDLEDGGGVGDDLDEASLLEDGQNLGFKSFPVARALALRIGRVSLKMDRYTDR